MRITNSTISLQSGSIYQRIATKTEQQPLFISFTHDPYTGRLASAPYQKTQTDILEISQEAQLTFKSQTNKNQIQSQVFNHMISNLTGQDMKILNSRPPGLSNDEWFLLQLAERQKAKAERLKNNQDNPPRALDSTVFYRSGESLQEKEILSFGAQGFVETADGRKIDIAAKLIMSREFAAQNNIDFTMEIAPFSIEGLKLYQDTVQNLRDTDLIFNIDSQGKEDQITSLLKLDGDYLGIDANQDGKMDLKELVSSANGDAFTVLSGYDEDNNGWIDEGDSIYDKLQIWTKDDQGNDKLFAIGQKGIGAICLANINSPSDINNQAQSAGQVQKSGVYLKEDGNTGFIQQVDFFV